MTESIHTLLGIRHGAECSGHPDSAQGPMVSNHRSGTYWRAPTGVSAAKDAPARASRDRPKSGNCSGNSAVVHKEKGHVPGSARLCRIGLPGASTYGRVQNKLCRQQMFIQGPILAILETERQRLLWTGHIQDT